MSDEDLKEQISFKWEEIVKEDCYLSEKGMVELFGTLFGKYGDRALSLYREW